MRKGKYTRFNSGVNVASVETKIGVSDVYSSDEKNFSKKYLPVIIIIALAGFLYSFGHNNRLTNWDDDKYIGSNVFFTTWSSDLVKDMFFSPDPEKKYFMGNYHPLTMLSLWVDYHYSTIKPDGKPDPERFYIVNVILHLAAAFFLYLCCLQLFKKRLFAIVITSLFAVHTLHVESVAWLSERKDVLYAMFYFLSLLLFIIYKKKKSYLSYILSLIVFILSGLSKGQAVSLAVTLFLVDYILTDDYLKIKNHLDKIPFLIIALIFGLISIEAQKAHFALSERDQYELYQRIAFGSFGFVQYILRLILPINLTCLYAYPDLVNKTVPWYCWTAIPFFIITVLMLFKLYRNHKLITFGIAFFIINIVLLLQFIPVGSAMYADRYSYIPASGFSVLVTLFMLYLIDNKNINKNVVYSVFGVYILIISVMTVNRISVWHDSRTLWEDCVSKCPEAVMGSNNLGTEYNLIADSLYKKTDMKKYLEYKQKAVESFDMGIKYKPDYVNALYNKSLALKDMYDVVKDTSILRSSLRSVNLAVKFDLNNEKAFLNRGVINDLWGDIHSEINPDSSAFYRNAALTDFQRCLDLDSTDYEAYINRSALYGKSGKLELALADLNKYLSTGKVNASAFSNRGLAYQGLGRYDDAIKDFNRALELDSSMVSAYFNRSITHSTLKQYNLAREDLKSVIKYDSTNLQALYYIGVYYFNDNKKDSACEYFSKASNLGYAPATLQFDRFCNKK